jgi:uncharacterized protein YndB with AHSA1/START domain
MTTTNDLGCVMHRDDGRVELRYERDLAHAPEKVWRALAESQHMTAWMPGDMIGERRAGASIELRLWPAIVDLGHTDNAVLPGTITVWDQPHVFEWTWGEDVIRWELEGSTSGTRLTLTVWIAGPGTAIPVAAAGYHIWLDALREHLDTGTGTPLAERDPRPVERLYEQIPR